MHVVCWGELIVDMFPAEVGEKHSEVSAFSPAPGGGPANVAVAAHRSACRTFSQGVKKGVKI
jgi:sugar/nucleoside kinase (ribokinase family)